MVRLLVELAALAGLGWFLDTALLLHGHQIASVLCPVVLFRLAAGFEWARSCFDLLDLVADVVQLVLECVCSICG